jgi:hypothetical protein
MEEICFPSGSRDKGHRADEEVAWTNPALSTNNKPTNKADFDLAVRF